LPESGVDLGQRDARADFPTGIHKVVTMEKSAAAAGGAF